MESRSIYTAHADYGHLYKVPVDEMNKNQLIKVIQILTGEAKENDVDKYKDRLIEERYTALIDKWDEFSEDDLERDDCSN